MMRDWNVTQENIYERYVKLGKILNTYSKNTSKQALVNFGNSLIAKEGFWKLPVSKSNGGTGLSWDECVIALQGLTSSFQNHEFFYYLTERLALLYLTIKFCSKEQKNLVISNITHGNTLSASFKDFNQNSHKKLNIANDNGVINFLIERDSSIFYEFINFKKILYGLLVAEYSLNIMDKYREKVKQNKSHYLLTKESHETYQVSIKLSKEKLYLLFSNLLNR
jgi:hypothetical protein